MSQDSIFTIPRNDFSRLSEALRNLSLSGSKVVDRNGTLVKGSDLIVAIIESSMSDPKFEEYEPLERYFTKEALTLIYLAIDATEDKEMVIDKHGEIMQVVYTEGVAPAMTCAATALAAADCIGLFGFGIHQLKKWLMQGDYSVVTPEDR